MPDWIKYWRNRLNELDLEEEIKTQETTRFKRNKHESNSYNTFTYITFRSVGLLITTLKTTFYETDELKNYHNIICKSITGSRDWNNNEALEVPPVALTYRLSISMKPLELFFYIIEAYKNIMI
jgi:hypothetical protein